LLLLTWVDMPHPVVNDSNRVTDGLVGSVLRQPLQASVGANRHRRVMPPLVAWPQTNRRPVVTIHHDRQTAAIDPICWLQQCLVHITKFAIPLN